MFPDGLSQRNYPNGDVTLHLPTGIKEYYTAEFKVSNNPYVCYVMVVKTQMLWVLGYTYTNYYGSV